MHYSTKRRVALGMTTGGLLMTGLGMSNAHADTTATGNTTHSPGVGSGNLIQLPINAPINVCGNQLDVIGILDSVTGNSCENHSGNHGSGATTASGNSTGSPGVGSGNLIQVPINAPINICGNQLDVIGIGNRDEGNSCENHGGGTTSASGSASNSPGIGAGNVIQVPINAPVNVCGNQLDVIGILNSVLGNSCENGSHGKPPTPSPTPTPTPTSTPPSTPTPTPTGTSCSCPPPPPPTTPCPPSGTATPTGPSSSSTPSVTPSSSASGGGSSGGGSNGGGANGGGSNSGGTSGSSGGSSGKPTGVLAQTGSGALAAAPFGAGLIGGGVMLRKRYSKRSH